MVVSRKALRVGLTGGIGSGKSLVASRLGELGAAVVDTDLIARQITSPAGAAMEALRSTFGTSFVAPDGSLDRQRMRSVAFADASVLHRLENILHPLIRTETERQATAAEAGVIVFDVPLLVESGRWAATVDEVWVVDCETSTQIDRVMARSGWTRAAVESVIAKQATRRARRAVADVVIFNDGIGMDALIADVDALWASRVPHAA